MLPGTLTAKKGKREHTLKCTPRSGTNTWTCTAHRKTHVQDSCAHTHRHIVPYCFHRMHAALSCQPFIWKCMRQKFLSITVPRFMALHCTTVLRVSDLSRDDGPNQSPGNSHLKSASLLKSSRLFCCEPITTTRLGPLYILSQLKSVRKNPQAPS